MKLVLLGPPGAGKGTLAEKLSQAYPIVHIATGDLFRYNLKNKTELGKLAQSYMDKGELVPDEITCKMMQDKIEGLSKEEGFLLDGFPRNLVQAEALDKILADLNLPLDAVINVKLADELISERLVGRRVCSACQSSFHVVNRIPKQEGICDNCGGELIQRSDDRAEVISNRLNVYHKNTAPLIEYYSTKGLLIDVDNSGSASETWAKLESLLAKMQTK